MTDLKKKTKVNIEKVKEDYSESLRLKKNVIGVGIGKKIVRGKETDETAIVVFVEKKENFEVLSVEDAIPTKIDGFKTDVVETEMPEIQVDRKGRHRPAMPGVSIGHYEITAGTFGCVVYREGDGGGEEEEWVECSDGSSGIIISLLKLFGSKCRLMKKVIVKKKTKREKYILSNNHVLANTSLIGDPNIRGDAILQQGKHDGGVNPGDKIARLHDYIEVDPDGCYVDCAIAKPLNDEDITDEILEIGVPEGIAEAGIGCCIRKSGRTTGLTTGNVLYLHTNIKVNYRKAIVLCKDQILCSAMSQGGDSGSVCVDRDNNIVGLLFAGSQNLTVINPIQKVFEELNVSL